MAETSKIMSLKTAVQRFVKPNYHISIGGFTLNRNPMAAVREIIRQDINGLHLYAHSNGQGLDELVGAGCVDRLDIAYSGNGRYAPTCICFRRMIRENKILVEDYTNFQMALRFMAGAMGVPFLPTYSSLGTDIVDNWGFNRELREEDLSLPPHKLMLMNNPFSRRDELDQVVLVPAIVPDVTIIHAQTADLEGNTAIEGLAFCDVDQAKAARYLIVTCETLEESLRQPEADCQIPGFIVDAVVHVPFGAYPTACYKRYDYDPQFLDWYKKRAEDEAKFASYVQTHIKGYPGTKEFMTRFCPDIESLKADPKTGYSLKVSRK